MQTLAETLPEYAVLRSMAGVGDRLGPLILAEIGDIRRFHSGKALNAYAGNDAPPYQSGTFESHNRHISKRGNAALRKYCFEVMQALKLTRPQDDPVYLFLLKKEQEGKQYNVAKMAGVNKFLRIRHTSNRTGLTGMSVNNIGIIFFYQPPNFFNRVQITHPDCPVHFNLFKRVH